MLSEFSEIRFRALISYMSNSQVSKAYVHMLDTVAFDDSIKAFERAAKNLPEDVKIQIQL